MTPFTEKQCRHTCVNQERHACKAGEKGNMILWTAEEEAGAQGLFRGPCKAKHCRDVLHSEPSESPSVPVQARCRNLATKPLPRDRRIQAAEIRAARARSRSMRWHWRELSVIP